MEEFKSLGGDGDGDGSASTPSDFKTTGSCELSAAEQATFISLLDSRRRSSGNLGSGTQTTPAAAAAAHAAAAGGGGSGTPGTPGATVERCRLNPPFVSTEYDVVRLGSLTHARM